ncbi:MAG: DNA polymerase IV [Candidatus Krumholzibacteriia bacterium]
MGDDSRRGVLMGQEPGERAWDRCILHVDMDAFFAGVEVLDDPSLRGRPVIVGGTPEGRGVVSAASYEARAFGVHSAMSAARARQLCPEGVFLPGRMERYAQISRLIQAVFGDYTPLVEPLSIDEAFLDVTGCQRLFGPGPVIGRRIKARIRDEIGLTASVGAAPNKFLAKLASDLDKPDGFVVITAAEAPALLAALPIERMWGVGRVSAAQMHALGIRTIGDLLAVPVQAVRARFGDHAVRWLDLGRGIDDRPVVPDHEAVSIGNETTFAEDIADPGQLQDILDLLVDKVARRLRAQGRLAGTLTLKARYPDFTTPTRSQGLPHPTDSTVELRDLARRLLADRLGRGRRPLRLLGVTASRLVPRDGEPQQAELFAPEGSDRDRRLDRIMDQVHGKFGAKLRRGTATARRKTE